MKIFSKFPTVNISKLNFWLVICIAKNFIWTTLKVIFSIFRFFCTLRFQIYKYCSIITNHTSMERLFIQLSDDAYISISKNWPLWLVLWSRVTYMVHIMFSDVSTLLSLCLSEYRRSHDGWDQWYQDRRHAHRHLAAGHLSRWNGVGGKGQYIPTFTCLWIQKSAGYIAMHLKKYSADLQEKAWYDLIWWCWVQRHQFPSCTFFIK